MASPKALRNAVTRVIRAVGPMARTTYIRTTVTTGEDELIGRGGASVFYDSKPDPQPVFHQLGKRQAMYLSTATLQLVGDDYKFIFPTNQFDVAQFEDPRVSIMLVDGNGAEYFRILYIDPAQYAGADVAFFIYARSLGHSTIPGLNIGLPPGNATVFDIDGGSINPGDPDYNPDSH
jgi:hypothetical protein